MIEDPAGIPIAQTDMDTARRYESRLDAPNWGRLVWADGTLWLPYDMVFPIGSTLDWWSTR